MRELAELKEGDRVRRLISSAAIPMDVWVVKVDDEMVYCALHPGETDMDAIWTFDKKMFIEIDERFGWGPESGQTGSWLYGILEPDDKTDAQLFLEKKAEKAGKETPPEL